MTEQQRALTIIGGRPLTKRIWPVCITCGYVLCALLFQGGALQADDVDALDRELLEALEGPGTDKDALEQVVPRLLKGTRSAAQRLADGQLDKETTRLQQQILDDLDALLKNSAPPPQNQPPSGSSSQNQQPSPQDTQSSDQAQSSADRSDDSQADGQSDPNAASKESQERTSQGTPGDAQRERRLGLSTAAWGHLPPKLREQMRSAFSEEYLPEYDALVRRYYEALARRRASAGD